MTLSLFGGSQVVLAPGWTDERVTAVLGGTKVLALSPGPGATLTVVAGIGSIRVTVDRGAQVTLLGTSVVGGRDNQVTPADGPALTVAASSWFGGVEIVEFGE